MQRAARLGRHLDLAQLAERHVDGGEVLLNDLAAALAILLLDGGLDARDDLVRREDTRDVEEAGLHDRVDPRSEADIAGHPVRVDDEQLQVLVDQLLLHLDRKLVEHLVIRVGRVEQDRAALLGQLQDLHRAKE